jgi:hypothetical protein
VSGSSKPCIQTQTIAPHTASQQQTPYCPHWRYECHQHVNRRYNKATYVHGLFVRATAASVGVFAPQAKESVQTRPIYRGNALSGSFRSMTAEETRAHTPHIAYRTHSNTLQRLQVAIRGSPWCRSTPKIAADLRQLIHIPPDRPLCRQAHACDRQLKENKRYALSNRFEQRRSVFIPLRRRRTE